jgi:hypothetical protein
MSELDKVKDTVLAKLLGNGLLSIVGFGVYSIGFYFANGLKINVGESCQIRTPAQESVTWEPERNLGDLRMFAPLLEQEIKAYRVTARHELILTFTNGYELVLIEHVGGFESFDISFPDGGFLPI